MALLEALRDLDRPGEVLDDENVSITLPRRFGLSGVVDAQIRRYEQEVRRGRRVPESEVRDLVHLVTRRPDAGALFHKVGRSLTAADGAPAWRAALPERIALGMAARRVRRRLAGLFGGKIVAPSRGPFRLHAVSDLLVEEDPKGEACALVTGLAQAVVEIYGPPGTMVEHHACKGRGGQRCAWRLIRPEPSKASTNDGRADSGTNRRPEDSRVIGEGDEAPDFALPADDGSTVSLSGLKGRRVVLYFYPKDDTSGCTVEACEFRDAHPAFESMDAVVLGVSPDGLASHEKFKAKHELPFLLLADEDHAVAEAYGVWREKSMYGRKYWGIERSTFLIDGDGMVRRAWRRVKAKGHADEVATEVRAAP